MVLNNKKNHKNWWELAKKTEKDLQATTLDKVFDKKKGLPAERHKNWWELAKKTEKDLQATTLDKVFDKKKKVYLPSVTKIILL